MSAASVANAIIDLQNRLLQQDGVVIRVFECSINCTAKLDEKPTIIGGFPHMQENCAQLELARRLRPASLLRWDLPAAIFNAGRCVVPSQSELAEFVNDPTKITRDGYYPWGYAGHNVTSAGVGWVFGDIPLKKRAGAFGHDAWTFNFRLSGIQFRAKREKREKLKECKMRTHLAESAVRHTSAEYAEARMTARRKTHGYPYGSLKHAAAAYKWDFVNTSMNCWWPGTMWDRAMEDQKAFAMLLAGNQETVVGDCSIWGSLYNQVHLSWNASDIAAIFYVNDTVTAQRSARQRHVLARQAIAASESAYREALFVQKSVADAKGIVFPVVQYRVDEGECFDGRPAARRVRHARRGKKGLSPNMLPQVFHLPGA